MSKLDFISRANPDKRWLEGLYEAFARLIEEYEKMKKEAVRRDG